MNASEIHIAIANLEGWKIVPCKWGGTPLWRNPLGKTSFEIVPPNYQAFLDAAVILCNRMAKKGWNCRLENGLDATWECTFTRHRAGPNSLPKEPIDDNTFYGAGDTAPVAICRAFLMAYGIDPDAAAQRKENDKHSGPPTTTVD